MIVRRIARPMLAAMFIVGGLDQLRRPAAKAEAAAPVVDALASMTPLPPDPEMAVRTNGAVMLAGGALLASGHLPRLASSLLAGALVPTTLAGHAFWKETDPTRKQQQQIQFLKNLGLLGGLLLAAVDTEGKPGVAYRAKLAGDSIQRTVAMTKREARHAAKAAAKEAKLLSAQAQNALS